MLDTDQLPHSIIVKYLHASNGQPLLSLETSTFHAQSTIPEVTSCLDHLHCHSFKFIAIAVPLDSESICLSLQLTTSVLLLCLSDHLNPPSVALDILGQLSVLKQVLLVALPDLPKLPSSLPSIGPLATGPFRSTHQLRLGCCPLNASAAPLRALVVHRDNKSTVGALSHLVSRPFWRQPPLLVRSLQRSLLRMLLRCLLISSLQCSSIQTLLSAEGIENTCQNQHCIGNIPSFASISGKRRNAHAERRGGVRRKYLLDVLLLY
jgi:hypothetical protein